VAGWAPNMQMPTGPCGRLLVQQVGVGAQPQHGVCRCCTIRVHITLALFLEQSNVLAVHNLQQLEHLVSSLNGEPVCQTTSVSMAGSREVVDDSVRPCVTRQTHVRCRAFRAEGDGAECGRDGKRLADRWRRAAAAGASGSQRRLFACPRRVRRHWLPSMTAVGRLATLQGHPRQCN